MADENRETQWRQGDLLTFDGNLFLLISHDCDICADHDIEPDVECIPCNIDVARNGSLTLGKNPRRLQLECFRPGNENGAIVELRARDKRFIPKSDLFGSAQLFELQLPSGQQVVLRRWLSARYSRSAFPNTFEEHMRQVSAAVDSLSKKQGSGIRALYFDLDDGEMIERDDPTDHYQLIIYVVYPTDTPDSVAQEFAEDLTQIFERAFSTGDTWTRIHLLSCDAVSEDAYTLAMHNSTKTWRVDHRSLGGTLSDEVAPDPDR